MKRVLVGGAAALIAGACALSGSEPSPTMMALRAPAAAKVAPGFVQGQPAEIIASQQFLLHSKNTGADYLVQVAIPVPPPTPENFAKRAADLVGMFPNRDAAAIYVLDGGQDFPAYVALRDQQFIIGVQHTFTSWQELLAGRERDLARFGKGHPPATSGEKFAAFITEELKPFIEEKFPVDPKKAVLAGYSLGGMFTLRMLAEKPDAFAGYLVGDPSYDPSVFDRLRETAPATRGQRMYVGWSEATRPDTKDYRDKIMAAVRASGSSLVVESKEFIGEDHGSADRFVTIEGMRWLFSTAPLKP